MDKKNKNNIAKILLAFGVLASPMMLANQVSADNSIANTTNTNNVDATATAQSDAVTTENVIKENKEDKEQSKEVVNSAAKNTKAKATEEATATENTAAEATETTTKAEEKSNENSDVVQNKKEVDLKLDASQRHELKEAGYTDAEIDAIEKEIAIKKAENPDFNVNEFVASKVNDKKAETEKQNKEANELGISDEIIGEKVSTNSTTGNDLSNKVTDSKITITTPNNKEAKKIKPIEGVANDDYDTLLNANVEFNVPKKTVENDYIDIDLSNNVSVNGLIEDFNPGALDSYYGPDLIAKADYDKVEKKLRYTFTKDVEKYGNVKVRTEFPLFIDKQVVTANGDQKVEVSVGNKTESKTYNIDYLPKNFGGTTKKINGKEVPDLVSNGYADISNVNFEKGTYDHVIYVNPKEMPQKGTLVQLTNMQGTNGVIFDEDVLNNAKLYVVKDLGKLSPSFHLDPENLVEVNPNDYRKILDKANNTITFELPNKTFDNPNKKDKIEGHSGLVISYEGKLNGTSTDDNFGTHVVFDNGRSNGGEKDYFTWDNQIYKATGNSDATGNKDVGRFEEFHVYQTVKSDGSITTDDYEYGNFQEGSADETYKTAKKDREGYTLVRVRSENDAKFDSKGAETTGNFVPGETLRVRYLYQKRPVEETGKFQEHHIYITKDKDGKEIGREVV
ncbi:MAG: Ig-like domain-containing protein, partial [Finegoldia magna]|uniref:Ig-like domain-containing protein n=1 Tax=Finegoldia magna TaxID=1260 RepID=UPI002910D06C